MPLQALVNKIYFRRNFYFVFDIIKITKKSRCGPSRYALMTGRYSLSPDKNRILKPGTPHLGELFKSAGYITGIVGKHQLGYTKYIKL